MKKYPIMMFKTSIIHIFQMDFVVSLLDLKLSFYTLIFPFMPTRSSIVFKRWICKESGYKKKSISTVT